MYRSIDVANIVGCSYRQLHYLTVCGVEPAARTGPPGPGSRYYWSRAQVVRLALAYHLADALPGCSVFPELAPACLADGLPEPPDIGYVMYTTDPIEVTWVATWADVRMVLQRWGSCAIARYDLADLVGDRLNAATLVHA